MAGEHTGNETLIHPVGLIVVLVLGFVLLFVRREYAVLPMLILACFIPSAQRLVILGIDLTLLRLLVLFGWTRLMVSNEFKGFSWTRLDTMVVAWMVSGTIVYVVQYGDLPSLVNRAGWMFDGLGMYFLFRCVLRSWTDLERVAWSLAVVSVPVAMAFLIEQFTGRNGFAVFGGVKAITWVRKGRLRCQGAFAHAILAGCFWASVMPLILALWWNGRRFLVCMGLMAAMVTVITCASSTPILSVASAVVALLLYPFRFHLRWVRWGLAGTLFLLHMVMLQPVWHLMARVSAVGGSTGWHRFKIMDATINHFADWALLGESNPLRWGVHEMNDITNQYILEALRGGFITLVLFIGMLIVAFSAVGKSIRRYEADLGRQMFAWCVGTALFTHVVSFFGVSYFGQIIMIVYLTLAMAANIERLTFQDTRATSAAEEITLKRNLSPSDNEGLVSLQEYSANA